MDLNVQHQTFFFFLPVMENRSQMIFWVEMLSPGALEKPGVPVTVHGENFYSWDKEQHHNQESQALTPPWWYLSSF